MAVLDETTIGGPAVAKLLKRDRITVQRWIKEGVAGVRLEAVLVGGRYVTSKEAVARFLERCAAAKAALRKC